jgi:monofunctional glycosyltransferase
VTKTNAAPIRPLWRRILRIAGKAALALAVLYLALILLYRFVDPPGTPLMLLRYPTERRIDWDMVPRSAISPALEHAVIASEDNNFCFHHGIDWGAVHHAIEEYDALGRLRGASTIDMQVARNLFLWPGGGFFRKGIEAALALTIDALWPKRRVMEIYLNVIEWGPGIYGAEAASRAYFHIPASRLTRHEAAVLAAVLPNPRRWSPAHPDRYIARRAGVIEHRIGQLRGYFDCLR